MPVMIFGGRGFIGSHLSDFFPGSVVPEVDIADPVGVRKAFDEYRPDVVVNAAGKTGRPNVDWCEDHKMETLHANVTGPLVLLEECMKRGIYMVHVGSGCIYDGTKGTEGFTEEDAPNFTGSFYSLTKAMSDQLLQPFPVLQLRLRMPFTPEPSPRNLISKLIKYKKVLDVQNSLTYLPDFFAAMPMLVKQRITGTYNFVNPGTLSPYNVMEKYKQSVDPTHTFERITLEELPSVVKAARSNCTLSSAAIQKLGVKLLPAEKALEEALKGFKA